VAGGLLRGRHALPGQRVAVVGDGPLGLLALLLLRTASPSELVLVGHRPARSALGLDCGATRVVVSGDGEGDGLASLAGRVDAVVDATNHPSGAVTALTLLRRGGTAVLLGISGLERPAINPDTIALGQLRVQGVFAASRAAWRWVVGLYAAGVLDPAPLVTHRLGLEEADRAFAVPATRGGDAVKVLVRPGG
jgi:threonine dehydrogenase-like Zn-dependent dehydrogenase